MQLLSWPAKVWVNGHQWAKQQARQHGIAFHELANGFAACEDPDRLQQVRDRLGPTQLQAFFDRWMAHIPTPLGATDQAGGYWWELSMRQIEVSRTWCWTPPGGRGRSLRRWVADNLGIGRPDEVSLIFDRRIHSDTDTGFATRVVTRGVEVTVNCFYKHSRIKQYLKAGRALRIETVINSPTDLGVGRRLCHLDELQAKARAANHRLLDTQAGRSGLRPCEPSLCAGRTAIWQGGMPHRSTTLRRSPGHGPGRRPMQHTYRRGRVHPSEPSRPGGRPAGHPLLGRADEL